MFSKIARKAAIALTVLGLAFGSVSYFATAVTSDVTMADSGGQKGEWDPG